MNLTYDERLGACNCEHEAFKKGAVVQNINRARRQGLNSSEATQLGFVTAIIGAAQAAFSLFGGSHAKKDAAIAAARAQGIQDNRALMSEYSQVAGRLAGRFYGLTDLKRVLNALFDQGGIPAPKIDDKGTRKIWENMAADFMDSQGGKCATSKYNCPPGLIPLAKSMPGATAAQVVDAYAASNPIHAADLRGGLERQIFMDIADAALAEADPNAPITYGDTPAAPVVEAPSAPVVAPVVQAPVVQTPAPVITPTQLPPPPPQAAMLPGIALNQAGVSPDNSKMISDLMTQLSAQGANQAQMMQAATNALAQRGVNTQAPLVMEAMKTEVAKADASPNYLPWIAGAVGLGLVAFILAKKR